MFNNLKIRYKVLLFPALFVVVVLLVLLIYMQTNNKSKDVLNTINYGYVPYLEEAILLRAELNNLQRSLQDAVAASDESMLEASEEIHGKIKGFVDDIAQNEVGKSNQDVLLVSEQIESYYTIASSVSVNMINGNFTEEVSQNMQEMVTTYNTIKEALDNIIADSKTKTSEAFSNAEKNFSTSGKIILGVFIIGLFVFVLISLLISNSLNQSIMYIKGRLLSIAEGKLNIKSDASYINRRDEIGEMVQSTEQLVNKLQEIITDVQKGIAIMAQASQEANRTADDLSKSANAQAANVEEVSSTMEEIVANISSNTDNSRETEKISGEAYDGIKDVAERANKTVVANKTIMGKISIINDIAFQTNLLALNAAVEAARAGEHGKGFAVVAAEVRKLAERSKVAAEEIVKLANDSYHIASEVGQVMEGTLPKVENTTKLVMEISAASVEQNSGANQVNSAIQSLNNATQQNAATSEQMAGNAEQLSAQAQMLNSIISYFTLDTQDFASSTDTFKSFKNEKSNVTERLPDISVNSQNETKVNLNLGDDQFKPDANDGEFESF